MKSLAGMLQENTISAAISQVETDIKAHPTDADLRAALAQLLCLTGNWQRAKMQLKSWQALKPVAQPTTYLLMQSVEAELQRQAVFAGQATPLWVNSAESWMMQMLGALHHDLRGEDEQAEAVRDRALEEAMTSSGQLTFANGEEQNTEAFSWLTDGDGRLGPVCELALNGNYYWLPFSAIAEIQFQAPQSAIDLVWSHALIRLVDGREHICQLPVRYPLLADSADALLLGKRTEWHPLGNSQHYAGSGLKTWFTDKTEFPLLNMRQLSFDQGNGS
ncbi:MULTISPECIES: type VI secretion system accessory protein TagJ [unclassified Serratia (in: enterobacteria)]|uniref:type VI secretion system accessory protein TagJ n=1 Tax=unclassified Serratia (in: enterobacteria) TaxID=2647522 RepID=UPI000500BC3D|nr:MULTISPECIES: type VI secretion system accessory protein TagJ [unclassified Serratia (in: enterobacteria)]KFK97901.1 protein of avirulence locus ImpE [Serratia sp. Ag2]KFL00292.1 protein of avirulence locus ImpE [Serratia sp. Ag1]